MLITNATANRRRVITGIALLNVLFLATVALTNLLLLHRVSRSMLFVGDVYGGISANLFSIQAMVEKAGPLFYVATSHVTFAAVLCAAPALSIGAHLWQRPTAATNAAERTCAVVFASVSLLLLMAMTVKFTVDLGGAEIYRVNARYYIVLIPLGVMSLFGAIDQGLCRAPRLTHKVLVMGAAVALGVTLHRVAPTRFVLMVDHPDMAWKQYSAPWITTVVVVAAPLVLIYYGWRQRPGRWVFATFYLALVFMGNVATFWAQRQIAGGYEPFTNLARLVASAVPADQRDNGVVFGKQYAGPVYAFLYEFPGTPYLVNVADGARVDSSMLPPGTQWIAVLGDRPIDIPTHDDIRRQDFVFAAIDRAP
jgi:hypothetical protein